jgi:Cd2+/Zn2+-exporting ATPase
LFGLPPICVKAFRTLRRFQFDANCMMVTAALGAVALGEYDEAASVAFLFAVSEFLEARATMKARKALSVIVNLRPDHANVIHPISKEIIIVPADQVPLGSLISVKTGDKIAADGVVVEGSTAIDESSLTGEAKPTHKKVGDQVSGGTINIGMSPLVIRTTTSVDDSAVARLIRLVEEAQSNRSPTENMIDTFARSYTPSVMFMAILMCTIPWLWGPETGRYWTLNGLIIVVIACPCA